MKRKNIFDVCVCFVIFGLLNVVVLAQNVISQEVKSVTVPVAEKMLQNDEAIRAYCIDYNWGKGGAHGFAKAGLWADAEPEKHVQWFADLGCNVIQTFAVSCNGYAWYKNGVVPEQPGLKHDFLTEIVKLGRQKNMKVFGYFCVGANNKWEKDHPELCYQMNGQQIPLTQTYLDYLCASIEDAVKKTDMDGFMLDWFYNPGGGKNPLPKLRWLPCEQKMYQELMGEDFPSKEKITPDIELVFRRKSIERAWQQIKTAAKRAKPNCIIWLTAYEVDSKEYAGHALLNEVDWLMNEAGDTKRTLAMKELSNPKTKLITCLANWNKQNPLEVVPAAIKQNVGIYGFTKPAVGGTLPPPISHYLSKPVSNFKGDDLNIAVLARIFNNLPIDYVTPPIKNEK
ncbi:MAG: family 10 glycosylhydrolase [Planctomycetaceae bacterium]|nr:family 10 glycosylhydrolase [Planctomycetaceae bacterium]